jgi:SOS-response transcriptional repressor LexA
MDIPEARKEVLRGFLAANGGFAAVVTKFKLTSSQASYLSQLTAKDSTASFGELSAKNWERRLKMIGEPLLRPANLAPPATAQAGPPLVERRKTGGSNISPVPMGVTRIPLISYVQAGSFTEVFDNFQPGDADDWLMTDLRISSHAFALQIKGDSMLPEFKPGDRVIIDPDVEPHPGDFVVAKNGTNEATFKKYRPRGANQSGAAVFELVPLNDDFPSIRSDLEPLRIIGTMVEHRKYRKPR